MSKVFWVWLTLHRPEIAASTFTSFFDNFLDMKLFPNLEETISQLFIHQVLEGMDAYEPKIYKDAKGRTLIKVMSLWLLRTEVFTLARTLLRWSNSLKISACFSKACDRIGLDIATSWSACLSSLKSAFQTRTTVWTHNTYKIESSYIFRDGSGQSSCRERYQWRYDNKTECYNGYGPWKSCVDEVFVFKFWDASTERYSWPTVKGSQPKLRNST